MVGNIILVRTKSWFGTQIRRVTNSYYNHVGMFISDNEVVEATMWGVKKVNKSKFEKMELDGRITYEVFKVKKLTPKNKITIHKYLCSQVGCPYDYIQLISLLFKFVMKNSRELEPIDVPGAFICSELVSTALDKVGIVVKSKIDKDCITPHDIAESTIVEKI